MTKTSTSARKAVGLAILLSTSGLWGCSVSPEPSSDPGGGKADGLSDFYDVDLEINSPAYFACDESISDERCSNPDTHGHYLSVGQQEVALDTQSTVRWASQDKEEIVIRSEDLRFLVPADKTFTVDGFASPYDISTRIGLRMDFRVDGERSWRTASWLTSTTGAASDYTLQNLKVLPNQGRLRAAVNYRCEGNWCVTNWDELDEEFDPLPSDAVVEYRLVFLPVWDFGDFNEDRYDFSFSVATDDGRF